MEEHQESKNDGLTVAAIAMIVYGISNVCHEALGHGVAALFAGAPLDSLTSMSLAFDATGLSGASTRLIAVAGTTVNLVLALLAFVTLRKVSSVSVQFRYFLWLLGTVNLLQGTGYLLFSGIGNIGDWAVVIRGLQPWWLWRLLLACVGGAAYWLSVRFALARLAPLIGADPGGRVRRANGLMLIPYFAGAGLYIVSGLFNPAGLVLMAVSAAAASLGGTCGLAWGPQLLKGQTTEPVVQDVGPVGRSWRWWAGALALSIPFVFVLGPGLKL